MFSYTSGKIIAILYGFFHLINLRKNDSPIGWMSQQAKTSMLYRYD